MDRPPIPKRFLGAFVAGHRASAREFIDDSFSYQLLKRIIKSNYNDTEALAALEYLTKFNNEMHKNVVKKGDPNALHSTDKLRKDCYSRENSKNRDILSCKKHLVTSFHHNTHSSTFEYEEELIEYLDHCSSS